MPFNVFQYTLQLKNYYKTPIRPLATFLYITNKCNLKCNFCEMGNAKQPFNNDIALKDVKDILLQLKNWGVKELYITGGEPFVRKDIWDILDYCNLIGMTVTHITTNGTLLSTLKEGELEILKESTACLQISIDSTLANVHDKGRGSVGTLEMITKFLKEVDRGKLPKIHLSTFITKENYVEIPALIQFASDHEADHINFLPVNFYSNFPDLKVKDGKKNYLFDSDVGLEDLILKVDQGLKLSKVLKQSCNLQVLRLWVKQYFRYAFTQERFFNHVMEYFVCSKPFNYIHVNYYGNLLPCSMLSEETNILGKDIKSAWGAMAIKYKELLLNNKYFPPCRSCYCDFPTNLRNSLIYHPLANLRLNLRLCGYYLKRKFSENSRINN